VQKPTLQSRYLVFSADALIRSFAIALLVVSVLWPASAHACSCISQGLPCGSAWTADAVFVGHVVSIESSATPGGFASRRRVELAVVEAFRGLQLSQVTLAVEGSTCDYPFSMGETYIIYAYRSADGQLSTSICARTRPVAQATDDLTYLRSLATLDVGSPARVNGRVQLSEYPAPPGGPLKPVSGVTVTATGGGRTFSTRSNDRGEFELTGLTLDTYELIASAPDGYDAVKLTIGIRDPRGCGTPTLYIRHDARVTGRVVDGRGGGIGGLPLELVRAAELDRPGGSLARVQTWTNRDGTFELRLVQPGEYLLGFNSIRPYNGGRLAFPRALHPGVLEPTAATRIHVTAGERVRLGNFVVPESINLVTVPGIVVDEKGLPIRGAYVALRDRTEGNVIGPRFVTNDEGRFAFSLVDGGKYDVHVTRYLGDERRPTEVQTTVVTFTAAADTTLVTAVLKPNRN
jgi:Carboxypeptidase regulatory-like domain